MLSHLVSASLLSGRSIQGFGTFSSKNMNFASMLMGGLTGFVWVMRSLFLHCPASLPSLSLFT